MLCIWCCRLQRQDCEYIVLEWRWKKSSHRAGLAGCGTGLETALRQAKTSKQEVRLYSVHFCYNKACRKSQENSVEVFVPSCVYCLFELFSSVMFSGINKQGCKSLYITKLIVLVAGDSFCIKAEYWNSERDLLYKVQYEPSLYFIIFQVLMSWWRQQKKPNYTLLSDTARRPSIPTCQKMLVTVKHNAYSTNTSGSGQKIDIID